MECTPAPLNEPTAASPADARPTPRLNNRLVALAVLLPCVGVLAIAALLHADAEGMGTHTQLGLPPCGFLRVTDLPCVTCGYTTAFTLAAHGQIGAAFATQPAAALMVMAAAVLALVAGWAACSGAALGPTLAVLWRPAVLVLAGAVVMGAWLYKIILVCG